MLANKGSESPVKVKLLTDMVVDGDACEKGDVVEMSARDARYLIHHGKVEAAAPAKAK